MLIDIVGPLKAELRILCWQCQNPLEVSQEDERLNVNPCKNCLPPEVHDFLIAIKDETSEYFYPDGMPRYTLPKRAEELLP